MLSGVKQPISSGMRYLFGFTEKVIGVLTFTKRGSILLAHGRFGD